MKQIFSCHSYYYHQHHYDHLYYPFIIVVSVTFILIIIITSIITIITIISYTFIVKIIKNVILNKKTFNLKKIHKCNIAETKKRKFQYLAPLQLPFLSNPKTLLTFYFYFLLNLSYRYYLWKLIWRDFFQSKIFKNSSSEIWSQKFVN